MSDNGTLPRNVIFKIDIKEELVDEDDKEKNDGRSPEEFSDIQIEETYAAPEVENIAYGAMQNEEVLPDCFPVPVGFPFRINGKEEEASPMPKTLGTVTSRSSPGDTAENQMHTPGNSKSRTNINEVVKHLHKKQKLSQLSSISSQQDKEKLQLPNIQQGSSFNVPETLSSLSYLLSPVPSDFTDSVSSSSTPLSTFADSSTSLLTSTQRSLASPYPSDNVTSVSSSDLLPTSSSSASSSSSSLPLSSSEAAAADQNSHEILRTGRKKLKRSCPVEALNVVQEILLNPSPCHVYHLHNLATFMTERMRVMDAQKRKQVESRLIQLILEEDL